MTNPRRRAVREAERILDAAKRTGEVAASYDVAASYERVSTRLQGTSGFSLGAQQKDSAQFAEDNSWQLPDDLRFRDGEDRAASGADWDLPGLNAMLDAARQGRFSILIVPTVDRFARDIVKALVLERELKGFGVRVVYMNAPVDDSPEGRLLLRQLQGFAEYEREKIRLRTSRGRREKVDRGQILGSGPPPYGYQYVRVDQGSRKRVIGLEPDPATAPIVLYIFTAAQRCSAAQIVEDLRAEGVPPPPGYGRRPAVLRWARDVVQRILTHPVYAGRMIYGGSDGRARAELLYAPDAVGVPVPQIVEPQLWEDVQRALERRQTVRRGRATEDPWLLRGLLTCGHCGGALSISWNRVRPSAAERAAGMHSRAPYRQYECLRAHRYLTEDGADTCPMRAARADSLESLIWRVAHDVLLDPEALRQGLEARRASHEHAHARRQERLDATDQEIARHVRQIDRIVDELLDTAKGSESHRALSDRQQRTETMLTRLRAERDRLAAEPEEGISQVAVNELAQLACTVARGLDLATVAQRRRVLDMLRVEVTLRMDPDGIQLGRVKRNRWAVEMAALVQLQAPNSAGPSNNHLALSDAFPSGFSVLLQVVSAI